MWRRRTAAASPFTDAAQARACNAVLLKPNQAGTITETLEPDAVSEGSAIYHMVRNVGSSIHISLSTTLAVRMARANYAELAPAVSPYNEALALPWAAGGWSAADPEGIARLGREIARQAAMIGYLDAFLFFIATALAVLPLVLLVRWNR
jgi:DHA2 family multidrug resistance protein